ncbi:uncharacterized protein LOC120428850 [Culex pipiens pallens]|uniref:(northern house mosquito) hypothetical protein n=1 Tax=Culex pipiens TaxID=7175 RepID=A0A8D8DMN9_CULPI|nr:uncharacterized protein LOC120428850 [Culex pipiens pallens]
MGNCLKGCLSEENQARLSASDSQYEMLVEGTLPRQAQKQQSKAKEKPKLFSKFWKRKDVEYSRLNKSKNNNNFIDRGNSSNQRRKSGSEIQLQCLDAHSLLLVSKDGTARRNGYHDLNTDMTSTPGSSLDLEWENDYANGYQGGGPWTSSEPRDDPQPLPYPNPLDPVFKVEEWSTLKRSKDRINFIRRTALPRTPEHPLQHGESYSGGGGPGTPSLRSYAGSYASSSHISTPEDSLEWDVDQDRQVCQSENESLDLETKELLAEIEQLKNRVLNETGANIKDLKFDESSIS